MESRTIVEYKVYVLYMNDMRANAEHSEAVVASFEKDQLLGYYKSMLVETPWVDDSQVEDWYGNKHNYTKFFKKGSPLEWYNQDCMIKEFWVSKESLDMLRRDVQIFL